MRKKRSPDAGRSESKWRGRNRKYFRYSPAPPDMIAVQHHISVTRPAPACISRAPRTCSKQPPRTPPIRGPRPPPRAIGHASVQSQPRAAARPAHTALHAAAGVPAALARRGRTPGRAPRRAVRVARARAVNADGAARVRARAAPVALRMGDLCVWRGRNFNHET